MLKKISLLQNFSKNYLIIHKLMRLHAPTGFLLVFFPASYGLLIAAENNDELYYHLVLFFGTSILIRAAGCIINDLIDRDLDRSVERTKTRPLAAGDITPRSAILILSIFLIICLNILLTLSSMAIFIGIFAILMIAIYPLMKRITYFPQVFLGLTFNLGALIGYASIKNEISVKPIILYIGCACWTIAYDTIYAFMDIKDDKKMGMKSTAIYFEHQDYRLILTILYLLFLLFFTIATWQVIKIALLMAIFGVILISFWIIYSLKIENTQNCLARFKLNNIIGLVLFLGLLLEKL